MLEKPLVSIVTPAFNQERFLEETIQSVLAQDYPNIEYIVINDGSTDGTDTICKKYADRLTYIQQENLGQATTLNRGWAIAKGQYLGYLSSDDLLRPNAVRQLVDCLQTSPSTVCVFPNSDIINENSKIIKRNVCRPFNLEETVVSQICRIGPGAIFRTQSFKQSGGWDPTLKLGPDREFWMRLANFGDIAFLKASLGLYRIHENSMSYKGSSETASLEYARVLEKYFSSENVSKKILARKSEAFGFAYFIVARNSLRESQYRTAVKYYKKAVSCNPRILWPKYLIRLLKYPIGIQFRRLKLRLWF